MKMLEEECIKSNWSTRQLERQITTLFYERLLSSKDKEKVSKEIYKLEPQIKKAEDIIKDSWERIFIQLELYYVQIKVIQFILNYYN
ncbi:hypothetical protein [Fusobacterium nucleatum]|uniref:hypothetical protein n=1 Tax=Fusobacterium nucleatum TaxID=851 RepID=UPI0030CF80C7